MLTAVLGFSVVAFFVIWFVISVLNQHRKSRRFVSAVTGYDICSMIPVWTFFAPNPGRTDLYLLYRDKDGTGTISDWRDTRLSRRDSLFEFWSPERRISKGIVDVSSTFTTYAVHQQGQSITKKAVLGFQYILLLNYVCSKPIDFRADMRQFALARTDGHGTEDHPDVIFLSAFHKVQINH